MDGLGHPGQWKGWVTLPWSVSLFTTGRHSTRWVGVYTITLSSCIPRVYRGYTITLSSCRSVRWAECSLFIIIPEIDKHGVNAFLEGYEHVLLRDIDISTLDKDFRKIFLSPLFPYRTCHGESAHTVEALLDGSD